MGRLRRWLIIAGAGLLVALLAPAGLYVWASTRDLSRYQNQIVDQIRRATGRELAIKGQLRVNFTFSPRSRLIGNTSPKTGANAFNIDSVDSRLFLSFSESPLMT